MTSKSVAPYSLGALVIVCLIGSAASASGINTNDPTLPPNGMYLSPQDVHAMYGNNPAALQILFSRIEHQPFKDLPPRYAPNATGGVDEQHDFASTLMGDGACQGSMCGALGIPPTFPVQMTGRVQTVAFNKGPTNVTGIFDTEMLGMNLVGTGGVMIRESPTRRSLGRTTIAQIGAGQYHIDSFFDVFTELSLDGGDTWMPSVDANGNSASTHVVLGIPEPGSVVLLAFGLWVFAGAKRPRR